MALNYHLYDIKIMLTLGEFLPAHSVREPLVAKSEDAGRVSKFSAKQKTAAALEGKFFVPQVQAFFYSLPLYSRIRAIILHYCSYTVRAAV